MASFSANWPAPGNVRTVITDRWEGYSRPPFDSLNLGFHVGDNPQNVEKNWQALTDTFLPRRPLILNQVHGNRIVEIRDSIAQPLTMDADGAYSRQAMRPCAVLTADCLPVLLCDQQGRQVAALHAGWRGLARGIITAGVKSFPAPDDLLAYLGPAICNQCFEVGEDVLVTFLHSVGQGVLGPVSGDEIKHCFIPEGEDRWLADLFRLAKLNLNALGVEAIYSHNFCTIEDERFFSFRRDGETGRFASIIWLAEQEDKP